MRLLTIAAAALAVFSWAGSDASSRRASAAERVDALGDPLPAGAIARLGTSRLKHANTIDDVAFSADGMWIASGSFDTYLALWDAKTGRREFMIDVGGAISVDFSPDGEELLVALRHGPVMILDRRTQQAKLALHIVGGKGSRRGARFSPDGKSFAVVSNEGPLELWRWANGEAQRAWKVDGAFAGAKFARDGAWLAAWDETKIYRRDAKTGAGLVEIAAHAARICDVDITRDGERIASGSEDGTFRVWDAATGRELWKKVDPHRLAPPHSYVESVAFSPDGKLLATCGVDSALRFWDLKMQKETRSFPAGYDRNFRWSADGHRFATFGWAITLRDTDTGRLSPPLPGHVTHVQQFAFIQGGKQLATTGSNDNTLRLWNLLTAEELRVFEEASSVTPIRDSDWVVASAGARLSLANIVTGERRDIATFDRSKGGRFWHPSISVDGTRMITVTVRTSYSDEKKLVFDLPELATWSLPEGKRLDSVGVEGLQLKFQLRPDGKAIYGWVSGRSLLEFPFDDLAKPRTVLAKIGETTSGRNWAISHDGKIMVVAREQQGASVIDLASGEILQTIAVESGGRVQEALFLGDDRLLLRASPRSRICSLETGETVKTFAVNNGSHTARAAISPDRKWFATSDDSRVVSLWDIESGRRLANFDGHENRVRALAFSPDGKYLVSGADDTTILVWNLDPAAWPRPDAGSPPERPTLDALWLQLGEREAARAYDAARQMIERPEEALTLLAGKIGEAVELPATSQFDEEQDLRVYRAAYVLEHLRGEEAKEIRARITRPAPRWDDAARAAAEKITAALDDAAKADKFAARDAVVSPDGGFAVRRIGYQNRLCDPKSGEPGAALPWIGTPHALTHDGRFCLALIYGNEGFAVYELASGTQLWKIATRINREPPQLHPDGRRLVFTERVLRGYQFATFDLLTGRSIGAWHTLGRGDDRIRSPDGALILTGGERLTVYDVVANKQLWQTAGTAATVRDFITNDLVAIGSGNVLRVHRARTGELVREIKFAAGDAQLLNVDPHLQLVAVKDAGGQTHVHELATQERVFSLDEPNVTAVRFLPGRKVQSLDGQQAVREWDLSLLAAPREKGESAQSQLGRLWPELQGESGAKAFSAALAFIAAGDEAVPFLQARLITDATKHDEEIAALIKQLDDESFERREEASRRLLNFGTRAVVLLRKSPLIESSSEVKTRAASIEKSLAAGVSPQQNRVAYVLDEINTPAAVSLRDELQTPP